MIVGAVVVLLVLLVWISSRTGSVEVYIDLFSPASFLSSLSIRADSLDLLSLGPPFPQQEFHCFLFEHRDWRCVISAWCISWLNPYSGDRRWRGSHIS